MPGFGLKALFEAVNSTKEAERENDALFESFEDSIDDEVKIMVSGDGSLASLPDDEEEIEMDMAGHGYDPKKVEELVKLIPEYDDDMNERIAELTESYIPESEL